MRGHGLNGVFSFPLITRELRVQSRNRATYTARVGWGLGALVLLSFFTMSFPTQSAQGRYIMGALHICVVLMLLVLAPLGAADAISREKREGTIGLLMLTHLSAFQIVLGKLAAHSIRLLYIAFMMLPFFMLPVLMGGVSLQDFLLSAIILLSVALSGLAAGLIASALFLSFGAALGWAVVLAIFAVLLIGGFATNGLLPFLEGNVPREVPLFVRLFLLGPGFMFVPAVADQIVRMISPRAWTVWVVAGIMLTLGLLSLLVAVLFAARRMAQKSEFSGETKRQASFRKRFLTPILWRERYRHIMRRKLDRNPFVWLEYRTAWARTARWAMILLAVVAETGIFISTPSRGEFLQAHLSILIALVVFLTLKSSSSFQREKESGAFELLLVTPLTEWRIWSGRLRAVASYYGLTVLLVGVLGVYGLTWVQTFWYEEAQLSFTIIFSSICASLFSVPICGLFFALHSRTFLQGLLWTAGLAILLPICLWTAFNGLLWYGANRAYNAFAMMLHGALQISWWPALLMLVAYHAAVSFRCGRATLRLLRQRDFDSKA